MQLNLNYAVIKCIHIFSYVRELTEQESAIFKPTCKRLNLLVQPPTTVEFLRKVCITEEYTGRIIEYKPYDQTHGDNSVGCDSHLVGCTVVSHGSHYGFIDKLFLYNATEFAIVKRFESKITIINGFVLIADCSVNSEVVQPLKEVSRPLIFASSYPKLWIINVH